MPTHLILRPRPTPHQPRCAHRGRYHREFRDCSARCAWGLTRKGALGMMHWSCCFETDDAQLVCSKATVGRASMQVHCESCAVAIR